MSPSLVFGEFSRTIDDRFRIAMPPELLQAVCGEQTEVILAKELPGCLSVWNRPDWQQKFNTGVELVQSKMRAGKLEGRWAQVQQLGRLLSTRHTLVSLAGRNRLLMPEGFRQFLGAEPNSEVAVVGAGVCLEIWRTDAWIRYVETNVADYRTLLDQLSG